MNYPQALRETYFCRQTVSANFLTMQLSSLFYLKSSESSHTMGYPTQCYAKLAVRITALGDKAGQKANGNTTLTVTDFWTNKRTCFVNNVY